MTVVASSKDTEALTMTFVAEFDTGIERVWQLWEDPRQLERWWGPPGWPATFLRHELVPGGESRYYMTGPAGERPDGYWRVLTVDAPHEFTFEDGFTGADGEPVDEPPVHGVVTLESSSAGTRMTVVSTFASPEQLEQLLAMGMDEGMRQALGQMDALLAA